MHRSTANLIGLDGYRVVSKRLYPDLTGETWRLQWQGHKLYKDPVLVGASTRRNKVDSESAWQELVFDAESKTLVVEWLGSAICCCGRRLNTRKHAFAEIKGIVVEDRPVYRGSIEIQKGGWCVEQPPFRLHSFLRSFWLQCGHSHRYLLGSTDVPSADGFVEAAAFSGPTLWYRESDLPVAAVDALRAHDLPVVPVSDVGPLVRVTTEVSYEQEKPEYKDEPLDLVEFENGVYAASCTAETAKMLTALLQQPRFSINPRNKEHLISPPAP